MNHTPGPWKATDDGCILTDDEGECLIATVESENADDDHSLVMADARLIAAAPDLLDALKESLCWFPSRPGETPEEAGAKCDTRGEMIAKAHAAIARAEREQHA